MIQRELPLISEVSKPRLLGDDVIAMIKDETDAVRHCWQLRSIRYSIRDAAILLGISHSHLSNIINGKKYLPHISVEFQQLCGNWAIRQYQDKKAGLITIQETEQEREIRLLKARIEELEAA